MICKSTLSIVLLALSAQVAYLQNETQNQGQQQAQVIIYPLEWDWDALEFELDSYCNFGMDGAANSTNASNPDVVNIVVSPQVKPQMKDLIFYLSQLVDAEMKRRCPGCGGLSAKPLEQIFNSSSSVPSKCSAMGDGRVCCTEEEFSNLTVCLTYDQMNIFYNYNLDTLCSALHAVAHNDTLCEDANAECVQKQIFAYMNGNLIYFWLHFDSNGKQIFYDKCKSLQGFEVEKNLFDQSFDFNPSGLVNATMPANTTQPAEENQPEEEEGSGQ